MQIDWITVTAQIVNFLVLVWLLKRFLYRPVIRAMDRREQRISERLGDAEERERQAESTILEYQARHDELDRQAEQLVAEAGDKAEEYRRQLVEAARSEVNTQRASWQQQVDQEKQEFLDELRRQTRDAVEAIARKALHDLADSELEARIVHNFSERLRTADDELREGIAAGTGPVRIFTTFDLEPGLRGSLTRLVHEHIGATLDVEYQRNDELLCGIELRRAEHRLGWNLRDYIEQLSLGIDRSLSRSTGAAQDG